MANQINQFKAVQLPINFNLPGASANFGISGRGAYDYNWVFYLGCVLAFAAAWGIGANDVANSFATSVGSRTLKMWQAVIIAGICEFLGAYLLGSRVTDTIRSGIVDVATFTGHEDLLMFGMLCAIAAVAFWLALATSLELPVSTTHTAIGAIIGFGLCSPSGGSAVKWDQVGLIVASWFVSPILCAIFSATSFIILRRFILRSENAFDRTFKFFPVLVFITVFVCVMFIMFKGGISKQQGFASNGPKLSEGALVGISFGVAAGFALIVGLIIAPKIKRYINSISHEDLVAIAAAKGNLVLSTEDASKLKDLQVQDGSKLEDGKVEDTETDSSDILSASNKFSRKVGPIEAFFDRIFHQDMIHSSVGSVNTVTNIHDIAEIFPLKTEFALGYLQVFTAMFASFAHGANDVANAIGPLAAINSIHESGVGSATKKSPVPDWILLLGGAGLVCGLAMYGHIIIAAMGVKMVKITPSRGFIIELCAAFVIVIGSFLGLPLSTTHTAVGGIVGVGLVEASAKKSVNWRMLARVFSGWVATLIIAGCTAAILFSWATFAPSQIYPLNPSNCLRSYGSIRNVTKGHASNYTVNTQDGLITGIIGFPSTGVIQALT